MDRFWLIIKYLSVLLLFILSSAILPKPVSAANFYVSKTGNNSNGISWTTAWNELVNINWSSVNPGDTVYIDGGSTACEYPVKLTGTTNDPQPSGCGMVYETVLTVNDSGNSGSPITIKLSDEAGRNGTARFFGGRSTLMTGCEAGGNSPRGYGVNLQNADFVTLDGSHWAGIMIYGYGNYGIGLANSNCVSDASLPTNITVRNVEVYDNGGSRGIQPGGTNLLFDRVMVHDNGQDGFQADSKTTNFVIRRSWIFSSRPATNDPSNSFFSACTHSDGVQIYAGGIHNGFTLEDSIFGPGIMHSTMLGDYNSSNTCIATTNVTNATVRNSILVGDHGNSYENNLHYKSGTSGQDGLIYDHVTSVSDHDNGNAGLQNSYIVGGTGRNITNSLFVGGKKLTVQTLAGKANNFCYDLSDSNNVCDNDNTNPNFRDPNFNGVRGENGDNNVFADFDFTITNPAIPAGTGSSIHSLADFFGQQTIPTATPPTNPTRTPTPTPTRTPTPTPLNCLSGGNGNINCDTAGLINETDLSILLTKWITSGTVPTPGAGQRSADLNGDLKVDETDLTILLSHWKTQ